MNKNLSVIAIGGCSCAGKTTLSRWIKQQYSPVTLLHLDLYYRNISDPLMPWLPEYDGKIANWDSIDSMDLPRFLNDFQQQLQTCTGILVVEGIFVFMIPEIQKHFHKKYFLKISPELALSRRSMQVYDHTEPESYFDKIVWPFYLTSLQQASDQKDIDLLFPEETMEAVRRDIEALPGVSQSF